MRTTAEVDKLALSIERQILIAWNRFNNLDFVVLSHLSKHRNRFIATHHGALHREIFFNNLSHDFLDRLQIFRSKRTREGKVVEKPIFNYRPDGNLSFWKETLHRLSH